MTSGLGESIPNADVSLVVIAFNERAHAAECVRSILEQQTDARFDLVFVDDGSTDGTSDVAVAAAAGDERLRLIRLPGNRGRGAARAAGVETARGRSIGFVDADITLPPDWLARCLDELPGRAAVGGIAVPDGDATVLARVSGATPRVVSGSGQITGNNVLFDADVFAKMGFDPHDRLGEDTRLAARLVAAGYQLKRVPGLIVKHEENKSYGQAIRWRYENGTDAATLPGELGWLHLRNLVWICWLGAWAVGIIGAIAASAAWLLLVPAASAGAGALHAVSRFRPRPLGPFLVACLLDMPLLTAYLVGRTVAIPFLLRGRR
jgi:glycosyltransferase involved in cell wall biosynthesis